MRAYIEINNFKEYLTIDCITLTNEENNEVLNLSFCDHDCSKSDEGISIRAKSEEIATFGLPKSLDGNFGNNGVTYSWLLNSKLNSIVFSPMTDNEEELPPIIAKDVCTLLITVGEQELVFDQFEDVSFEYAG